GAIGRGLAPFGLPCVALVAGGALPFGLPPLVGGAFACRWSASSQNLVPKQIEQGGYELPPQGLRRLPHLPQHFADSGTISGKGELQHFQSQARPVIVGSPVWETTCQPGGAGLLAQPNEKVCVACFFARK